MSHQVKSLQEIVISGLSGSYPLCDNVQEFKENLFAKNYLVSLPEVDTNHKITPFGYMKNIDKFDNMFFYINNKHAEKMEAVSRMILEKVFEAILDSGHNPNEFKGTNTGVFVGSSYIDTTSLQNNVDEYSAFGKFKTMAANRISHWLDINGPSYVVDTACSSSAYALEHAYRAIQDGICDAAIVAGVNTCMDNDVSEVYYKSGILSSNSVSKVFDDKADGFVRAEAVVTILLQKKKNARRIYANLLHVKTNCDGFKSEGILSPSKKGQTHLYESFYGDINIDPSAVNYIEAHGTGTKAGDMTEVDAFEEFFCKGRSGALKIGSVKSNMGHSEAAAALCSITKVIIAYETGFIPPHINFNEPNSKIAALHNGKIEIVTEPTPCENFLIAVCSFGIGGANGHTLLSQNSKEKKCLESTTFELPILVVVSGRSEEAINVILTDLEQHKQDVEYAALYHRIFAESINGHLFRGYTILQNEKETVKHLMHYSDERRPIWFIFSGMGSQWPAMGKSLMKLPVFAESIYKSHEVLKNKNLDLVKIITEDDPKMYDNIIHAFVGIAAIQIALVDLLQKIEIIPDGIIGHSVGELVCAYADGCLTAEQTILVAYFRGLVSLETKLVQGAMAAVGEGYEKLKDMIPPKIDIACHNSSNSCTISGLTENVEEFLVTLKEKNIFARSVNSANIAFHSRYISSAGPQYISLLRNIIPKPKLRSQKWVCTSAPESEWETDEVKHCGPEYHTNNLLSSVLFEESSKHIPDNAIAIEIAPHGLLQAILKRSLPSTTTNIPLTLRNHEDNLEFLLHAIGKLYELGVNPKLYNLYPPIEFPVSRGTPMISHLIKWQHDEQFPHGRQSFTASGERDVIINTRLSDHRYLTGHVIDGRNIFPATGYLVLVWETLAIMNLNSFADLSVVFEDIRFERATNIPSDGTVAFHINVQRGTGTFEILNNESVVVRGRAFVTKNPSEEMENNAPFEDKLESGAMPLSARDIYKELRLRGYHYKEEFKKVTYANPNGKFGKVSWNDNFVTFMDTVAHIALLQTEVRDLVIPTAIRKIVIDVKKHYEILETLDKEKPEFPVYFYEDENILCSGGVEMKGFKCSAIVRNRNVADPVLEKYTFVSYDDKDAMDLNNSVRCCVHIILENIPSIKVKCVEIVKDEPVEEESLISILVAKALADLPLIQAEISLLVNENHSFKEENLPGIKIQTDQLPLNNSHLFVITSNISKDENAENNLIEINNTLREHGFIITRETIIENELIENLGFNICFSRVICNQKLFLIQKKSSIYRSPFVMKITNTSYSWIDALKQQLKISEENNKQNIILYAEKEPLSGILGLFNCLRREPKSEYLRCFFIMDVTAPNFSLDNEFYKKQFEKNLAHNVYKNGKWGSYRHLLLNLSTKVESIHAFGDIIVRGDLSTLAWLEGPLNAVTPTPTDKRLIHSYYLALNFRDVVLALGKVSLSEMSYNSRFEQEGVLGFEFCGKDENGARYFGINTGKGLSNYIQAKNNFIWKIPDSWTMEEATTVPVAYFTAITCLIKYGDLKKKHSVLIHAGSGGVGQACLNICTHYGCTIFTTVGTPEKVKFIREKFPQIPESHIGNSRDTSFEKLVMKKTKYRGVDLVINSLSEEKLKASVRCVAKGGKFLEIGKYDLVRNNLLELGHFLQSISFQTIMLDTLFKTDDWEECAEICNLMTEFMNNGIIKPLTRTVFSTNEMELAFRYMATGKHIGKVLIKLRDEDPDIHSKPKPCYLPAIPRVLCKADKSYVIIGGLGGFGLELADWLILRGARNVVLSSRNGIKKGYQFYRKQTWEFYGVNVVIDMNDVTTEEGVRNLLKAANELGPVDGIFNLAVVLQDDPFEKQTEETFKISANPKEVATFHLDRLSRKMCPNLNYFVVFSSVTCGRGNLNQTNYGMTNSVMERICETRVNDKLPALAVEWGAIGEVGVVADMAEDNMNIVIGGTLQQKVSSCLQILNDFMKQPNPIVSSIVVAEKRLTGSNIINTVANVLGIKDLKTISLTWTLPELGLDSMSGIELKQILDAEFETFFTVEDMKTLTFAKLYKMIEQKEKNLQAVTPDSSKIMESAIEKSANLPILRVPSLAENGSIIEVSTEKIPTIFYFPGLEGDTSRAKIVGANLNAQILCLHYYCDGFSNNMEETAGYYASLIMERLTPNQKFYIASHSIGTIIAAEAVKVLENHGRSGHLLFIDGSIEYLEMRLGKPPRSSESDFQMHVIKTNLPDSVWNNIDEKLLKRVEETDDWNEKKKIATPIIIKSFGVPVAEHSLDILYSLQKCMTDYKFMGEKLKTKATLIRTAEDVYNLGNDYGWSKYFEHPIKIHLINAKHETILSEKRTTELISEMLLETVE